ncbi:Uncharacterised protein [Campylobacter geochelonis]|uniref:Uncharacterized protein n=1 Tax=Campylobacter geochelonis TaxID=1780362 RepID=A0A128ELC8_9BACT|nr:putative membrane protein [Campylobacter geochelonis]CZE49437.1 Uncharacterised protein [Campylobacter geochelonis]
MLDRVLNFLKQELNIFLYIFLIFLIFLIFSYFISSRMFVTMLTIVFVSMCFYLLIFIYKLVKVIFNIKDERPYYEKENDTEETKFYRKISGWIADLI